MVSLALKKRGLKVSLDQSRQPILRRERIMREGGPGRIFFFFLESRELVLEEGGPGSGGRERQWDPTKGSEDHQQAGPQQVPWNSSPLLSISNTAGDIATAFNLPPPLHRKGPGAERSQGIRAP